MNSAIRVGRAGMELTQRVAQEIHGIVSTHRQRQSGRPALQPVATSTRVELTEILARIEHSLTENVLSFWVRHAPDPEYGGFITHLDREGRPFGSEKYLMMQARVIWTFSAAHRHGLREFDYLALARTGVAFLLNAMWDRDHGGFVWSVTRDGQLLDDRKLLYGQAFAIYALAEYAMASRDPTARTWAERTFDVLQQRAADRDAGFLERFARDWRPASPGAARRKTANAHLHLLEAVSTLVEASSRRPYAAVLRQLVELLLTRAIDPQHGCLRENFDVDWRPDGSWRRVETISYGHGAEAAWLVLRAVDLLGINRDRWREQIVGLIDHALACGFDRRRGGLAQCGPPAGDVRYAFYCGRDRLTKRWWEQAELLVATLEAYCWTHDSRYLAAFEMQFDWIWRHQIDHQCGEWFRSTSWREGRPLQMNKGDDWKCPYHTGRALMEVSRRLRGATENAYNLRVETVRCSVDADVTG